MEFLYPNAINFADDGDENASQHWVEAFKRGPVYHPVHGMMNLTDEQCEGYVKNFSDKVRGIDVVVDYEHELDRSKGKKAAGWIRDMVYDKSSGVGKMLVDFTEEARREISDRQWRYFSPRLADVYTRTDTGEKVKNVVLKGSLTNTPVFKGLAAIEFSEGSEEKEVTVVLEPPAEPEPELPDPPKNEEEGDKVDEAKIREIIGIGKDDDLEATLTKIVSENKNFAELTERATKVKNFAEDYPEMWKEHQENKKKLRKAEAKDFAETYLNPTEDSKMVMPPAAREALEDAYIEFSEGAATVETLATVMDAARKGFVEVGERGGGNNDEPSGENREELIAEFAEKMGEHMAEGLSSDEAYLKAKQECPKGYEAYTSQEIPAFVANSEGGE